jgi:SPP1 family predicted phage head-tail adaptor
MAKSRVRAGDLRRRVVIQRQETERDEFGGRKITWLFENSRWAEIKQLSGREIEIHSRPEAAATHRIKMRFYKELSTKQRFEYNGRVFNIVSVDDEFEGIHTTICIVSEEAH